MNVHLTRTHHGEVSLEAWDGKGKRKVTVYVTPDKVEFIRVWGADIDTEMDPADASDGERVLKKAYEAAANNITAED